MRIAWVLPDGERNRRFNKLKKDKGPRNKVTPADPDSKVQHMVVPMRSKGPIIKISNEEWAMIEKIHK